MMSVVQGVVAYDLTGKNGSVGAVALGMGIATLLLAPFAGVLADRVSKRLLLLIGQTTIGVSFLAVALLITTADGRGARPARRLAKLAGGDWRDDARGRRFQQLPTAQ